MLLCHALGWRSWQEDLMIFYGLKLHIPGRSHWGQHSTAPSLAGAFARCPCCVFHPWFPFGREVGLCSAQGERANKSFQQIQRPGSRAAASLCSFHSGLPLVCVMTILLASWANYGPVSIPIYESMDGRTTNATM